MQRIQYYQTSYKQNGFLTRDLITFTFETSILRVYKNYELYEISLKPTCDLLHDSNCPTFDIDLKII